MQRTCTALTTTSTNECRKPVPEDAGISLCAFHLLLAEQEVDELGKGDLIVLARQDAGNLADQTIAAKETDNV